MVPRCLHTVLHSRCGAAVTAVGVCHGDARVCDGPCAASERVTIATVAQDIISKHYLYVNF